MILVVVGAIMRDVLADSEYRPHEFFVIINHKATLAQVMERVGSDRRIDEVVLGPRTTITVGEIIAAMTPMEKKERVRVRRIFPKANNAAYAAGGKR